MSEVQITRTMTVEDWSLSLWSGDDELRIKDLDLADRLGYKDRYEIRPLIDRRLTDPGFGEVFHSVTETTSRGGRPGRTYHLTEAQALEISAISETPNGKVILRALIRIFMLARRGLKPNQGNAQWAFSPTYVEKIFEGKDLTAYIWEEKPVWIAKEVGRTMGYGEEGKGLLRSIQDWKEEMIPGVDFDLLEGEPLARFKDGIGRSSPHQLDSTRRELLILREPGFHLVCIKTEKPIGIRLRRWLAEEVLPSLVRTGSYQSPGPSVEAEREMLRPSALLGLKKAASEGERWAIERILNWGSRSRKPQKKPTSEPREPTPKRAAPKTDQIKALLLSGLSPKEVVLRGFTKAHVYLIAARLRSQPPAPN